MRAEQRALELETRAIWVRNFNSRYRSMSLLEARYARMLGRQLLRLEAVPAKLASAWSSFENLTARLLTRATDAVKAQGVVGAPASATPAPFIFSCRAALRSVETRLHLATSKQATDKRAVLGNTESFEHYCAVIEEAEVTFAALLQREVVDLLARVSGATALLVWAERQGNPNENSISGAPGITSKGGKDEDEDDEVEEEEEEDTNVTNQPARQQNAQRSSGTSTIFDHLLDNPGSWSALWPSFRVCDSRIRGSKGEVGSKSNREWRGKGKKRKRNLADDQEEDTGPKQVYPGGHDDAMELRRRATAAVALALWRLDGATFELCMALPALFAHAPSSGLGERLVTTVCAVWEAAFRSIRGPLASGGKRGAEGKA